MAKQRSTTPATCSVVRVLVVLLIGLWTAGAAILDLSSLWILRATTGLR